MSRIEGVPLEAYRDVVVVVARGHLLDAERVDYETAGVSVLAGILGGLEQSVRDLLEVLGDQEAGR